MKMIIKLVLIQFLFLSTTFSQTDTLWTKTFGGLYSDGANAVCETHDGSIVLAGYTYSQGTIGTDIQIVKCDAQGNQLLADTFGGAGWDIAYSICNASDNSGYVITGHTSSSGAGSKDVFLLKTDDQLNQLWFKTYGGSGLDEGRSVIASSDGGYIICGYTESFGAGENDIFLIKTDLNGDTSWTKSTGCSGSDMGHSIYETSDGHYIIAGSTGLYDTPGVTTGKNSEIYVMKINLQGEIINSKTFWVIDNDQGDFDVGYSICETTDGNYCVAGISSAEGQEVLDLSVIKMDTSLNIIWKRNKEAGYYDFGYSICTATPGNGVIIGGKFNIAQSGNSDLFLIRLDEDGNELWRRTYGGSDNDGMRSIVLTADDNFLLAGQTRSFGAGSYDMWLLKLHDEPTHIDDQESFQDKSFRLNQNYPNPFNPATTISFNLAEEDDVNLTLFDSNGRKIKTLLDGKMRSGEHEIMLKINDLASGVYFYKIQTLSFTQTRKLVLLK